MVKINPGKLVSSQLSVCWDIRLLFADVLGFKFQEVKKEGIFVGIEKHNKTLFKGYPFSSSNVMPVVRWSTRSFGVLKLSQWAWRVRQRRENRVIVL